MGLSTVVQLVDLDLVLALVIVDHQPYPELSLQLFNIATVVLLAHKVAIVAPGDVFLDLPIIVFDFLHRI